MTDDTTLAERIDAALPQTQCTRCSYADCRAYAEAIAQGEAQINQCPPGGAEGVARLAALTGQPVIDLNPIHGVDGPRRVAFVDEAWCIGCTLCIKACPVDCIIGAPKRMHVVIEEQCTGCELCIPACPVDCIVLEDATPGASGWAAWSEVQAREARERYATRRTRLERERHESDARLARKAAEKLADLAQHSTLTDPATLDEKRVTIEAALARARAMRQPA